MPDMDNRSPFAYAVWCATAQLPIEGRVFYTMGEAMAYLEGHLASLARGPRCGDDAPLALYRDDGQAD